jgi:hypothetical protein
MIIVPTWCAEAKRNIKDRSQSGREECSRGKKSHMAQHALAKAALGILDERWLENKVNVIKDDFTRRTYTAQ